MVTLILTLPLVAAQNAVDAPTSASTSSAANPSLRILAVDDNKDSADSLSLLLELLGNDLPSAYDGEQALEMAKELRPDVVLLDLGLPKLNGYQVAKQIRLEPWGNKAILIAITGWGQAEDKELSPRGWLRSSPREAC